jgi:hypothetical protein
MHATNCVRLSTSSQSATLAALRRARAPLATMIAEYACRRRRLMHVPNVIAGITGQILEAAYCGGLRLARAHLTPAPQGA